MRPNAVRQIKTTLALEKIAKLEKLEPAEDEIEAYYTDMASRYGVDIKVAKESIPIESVKDELNLRSASKLVCDNASPRNRRMAGHDAKEKRREKAKRRKPQNREPRKPRNRIQRKPRKKHPPNRLGDEKLKK